MVYLLFTYKHKVIQMLKKEDINIYKKNYINDKSNKIRQRMLNKVPLVDLIQNVDTELNEEFNINIKTHSITDQQ